jgi:hypothetical protein
LDDTRAGYKFNISSDDEAAKEREGAAHFATNLSRPPASGHARLAKLYDPIELCRLCQRFIHALPARFENDLLMNGLSGPRDLVTVTGPRSGKSRRRKHARSESRADHAHA